MKSLAAFVALLAIVCAEEEENSSRTKRDYSINYSSSPANIYNNNPPSYSSTQCPSSNDYQIPYCKPPPACLDPSLLTNPNVADTGDWTVPRAFFVTASTCYGLMQVSSAVLGRSPRTNRELSEMCPSVYFYDNLVYNAGYGNQVVQHCSVNGNAFMCATNPNSDENDSGTDPSAMEPEKDYPVFSKEGVFVMYYRCINNRYADFQLLTVRPYADRYIINAAYDRALQLGFSPDQIQLSQCQPPTVYPPFQNYPIPAINPAMGSCPASSPSFPAYTYPPPSPPAPAPTPAPSPMPAPYGHHY